MIPAAHRRTNQIPEFESTEGVGYSGVQESALVFVLGTVATLTLDYTYDGDGNPISATVNTAGSKFLSQYSNVNGYHVRTIPGSRWASPYLVAAGAGRVAVADGHLIRVTDKYGGAPQGIDDPAFDWSTVADDVSLDVGGTITGMQITDKDILVAGVDKGDGKAHLYKHDFGGFYGSKLITLPDGHQDGVVVGRPCSINPFVPQDMYKVAFAVHDGVNSASVKIFDTSFDEVIFTRSIPSGWIPVSVLGNFNALHVLCKSAVDATVTKIFRWWTDAPYDIEGVPPSGRRTDEIVTSTFTSRDGGPLPGERIAGHPMNSAHGATVTSVAQYKDLTSSVRNLTDGLTAAARLLNRTPALEVGMPVAAVTPGGVVTRALTVQTVPSPTPDMGGGRFRILRDSDADANHVCEAWDESVSGDPDREKPLFRSLHLSHFDYLSEGGYTYRTDL